MVQAAEATYQITSVIQYNQGLNQTHSNSYLTFSSPVSGFNYYFTLFLLV